MNSGKKYSNEQVKTILFDLLDGNGGIEIMDMFIQYVKQSISKFNLSDQDIINIYNSYRIQIDSLK